LLYLNNNYSAYIDFLANAY